MSTNSATTTTSTDNGISLIDADERVVDGGGGDDQLTINSLSSSLSSSTATTDTENENGAEGEGGRKRKKKRTDGSFSRGSSAKEIEEIDGVETAQEEEADAFLEGDEVPPYVEKTRDRAIGRLITFSCILFTVPLTLMYITYRFLFIGHYNLAHDRAILYAGIVAAATVYVILAVFAWIAYRSRDETEFAEQVAISGGGESDKKTD